MLYTIYRLTNLIDGKIYVGKHQTVDLAIDDGYIASGSYVNAAIRKHGIENFKRDVIFVFDDEKEMEAKEREIVDETFVSRKDTYNLVVGGQGGKIALYEGHPKYDEIRRKIGDAHRGRSLSREHRKAIGDSQRGKKRNDETKSAISSSLLGKRKSPEAVEKRRKSLINTVNDPNYVSPMRGRKLSEDHRRKVSDNHADISGSKNPMFGSSHSEDAKKKLSNRAKQRVKMTCTHCGKEADASNFRRWHGDNCKMRM